MTEDREEVPEFRNRWLFLNGTPTIWLLGEAEIVPLDRRRLGQQRTSQDLGRKAPAYVHTVHTCLHTDTCISQVPLYAISGVMVALPFPERHLRNTNVR